MTRNKAARIYAALSTLVLAWGMAGCGTTDPGLLTMTTQSVPLSRHHQKSVFVVAEYNKNPRWQQQLSYDFVIRFAPSEIANAVQESIKGSKAFRQVFFGPGADYVLNVTMVNMDVPDYGPLNPSFNMKVDLEALWTLTDMNTNKIVFKEPVKSTYTSTTSQSFEARGREAIAIRGAIRENISLGLAAMSRLKLD